VLLYPLQLLRGFLLLNIDGYDSFNLKVPCVKCGATIFVEADTGNPLYLFKCGNCKAGMAVTSNNVVCVSPEFIDYLEDRYGAKCVGAVLGTDLSDRFNLVKGLDGSDFPTISKEDVSNIRDVLKSDVDVNTAIDNLGDI
jgi:hypothetical protein